MPNPANATSPLNHPLKASEPYATSFEEVLKASERLKGVAHETPVLTSRLIDEQLSERAGCEVQVHFKCENLQRVGAFKLRGGYNAVAQLSEEAAARGVCTHSSGNHAQAVAFAARARGIKATIIMPTTAPKVKREAVLGYGAEVIECSPTLKAREATTQALIERTGAHLVHPYNDPHVIAGQGTATLELSQQVGALDALIAPIGGGGLMAGACLTLAHLQPHAELWGAEPLGADDAARSLAAGRLIPQDNPQTICDGLHAGLGSLTWPILRDHLTRVITPTDEEVIEAMRLVWSRLKLIIEPSCAVALAALFKAPPSRPSRVGLIISGGNVDLDRLPW